MKLKLIQDENFGDYGFAISMLIACEKCDYKCATDGGFNTAVCQNSHLAQMPTINLSNEEIFARYKFNPITSAIILAGMEPFLQFEEILDFIRFVRLQSCSDTCIIYTGYREDEVAEQIDKLKPLGNIIVKFGRYVPNGEPHFDEVLGVVLANQEQYAKRIC